MTGVIDIGPQSDRSDGAATFAMGRISADFHCLETTEDDNVRFRMSAKEWRTYAHLSFNPRDSYCRRYTNNNQKTLGRVQTSVNAAPYPKNYHTKMLQTFILNFFSIRI